MSALPPDCADPVAEIRRFAAYLREHGFLLGLSELRAMVEAGIALGPAQHHQIRHCWRAIAASSAAHWRRFPDLFDAYWYPRRVRGSTRSTNVQRKSRDLQELVARMHADMDAPGDNGRGSVGLDFDAGSGDGAPSEKAMGGASRVDPLHRDFRSWLPDDIAKLESCIAPLEQRLRKKLIRKWQPTHRRQRIDLPASIRQSLSAGGELLKLRYRQRDEVMPRIYVLVDVSKSMEAHAQFFLRIGRAFGQLLGARVFVFHTRLAEITTLLSRNSGRVQEKINAVTFGFGGGTRIAGNLESFLRVHAGRKLGARDLVYVLSDGYDTDPPDETERAVRAIRRRGAQLYWLHPNRELPGSEALLRCRELINGFLAVDSLKSLENLVHLGTSRTRER
ncbi:MAG: VWA domain-containing protein [Burkholderiaceae bacterium]|nr:VWA domain-containing protein [Burkholderiaceae bacterium]